MFVAEQLQETFKLIIAEDVVFESAMISVPTLLLYGSADRATPPDFGRRFAKQIEQSELLVIENADHFLHHTHVIEVANYIESFLEKA
jgi:pimeloyl-ACP methyl ester carboxylesterase